MDALADSRAVAVLGARQVGKSTLIAQIAADEHPARLISLDDDATAEVLRDKLGPSFKVGVVLHTGASTLPFGDRLAAVPVSGLWS